MVTVFEQGPYLQAAMICERVLQEKDGVISIIRVIDRVTRTVVGPDAPEEMEPFNYELTLLVTLKSGPSQGTYQVRIDIENPSGIRQQGPSLPIFLEGQDRGQNLILNMNARFTEPGLYWFDVYFDERLMTRVPFRVVYARTMLPGPPGVR
jgi:hypothetical protein